MGRVTLAVGGSAAMRGGGGATARRAHGLPTRDGVPRKSELGVLRHQLGLQRPSVAIRRLIGEMPTTFTKLAPCVLMSPLSIAQYLPAEHASFDIVIFDEASQITTWDAVGAIARGRQSIIVGDPKQLPPTNFFGRSQDDADDLEEYEKDLQSILDEASAAGLKTHNLTWHYRSRDESLIAFSNEHYYGNRLITFPSPKTASDSLVFHKVDGIYASGAGRHNAIEAQSVCDFALRKLHDWIDLPEGDRPTLGIITFNMQQRDRILDLLDAARRAEPALEWFFDDDRIEPVIVKNLENIQGDERDVMLFSITFGPNAAGKISMNFGAMNREGGERRLNVAITRARTEMHVFSSLLPEDIDTSRTKALGVDHLKRFLAYAATGPVAMAAIDHGSMGPTESAFEASVKQALEQRGWEVRTQIGVSGFRIDLGVVHPDFAGAFLAGIECDGATYHRSATARDRDQVREAVLRGLGWEILRIWSTDWFMNSSGACDHTDAALRDLLEQSRARAAEKAAEEARKVEEAMRAEEAAREAALAEKEIVIVDAEWEEVNKTDDFGELPLPALPSPEALPPLVPSALETQRFTSGTEKTAQPVPDVVPEPIADPTRFYEENYTATLEAIVSKIVASQGPLRDYLLVRAVARAHGWARAGGRIRARVEECFGSNELHNENEASFVWAPGTYAKRIPFRPDLDRSPRDIPLAEILALIESRPKLSQGSEPVRDLARAMGIGRLSEDARAYLEECLKHAQTIDD